MKIAILIATRNRPNELECLLESILMQSELPAQIVIVSSGKDISYVIQRFEEELKLDHYHIDGYGQIRQKMFGVQKLSKDTDWVLFLDDDLILRKNSLEQLKKSIVELEKGETYPVIGIGIGIPSTSHLKKASFEKFIARLFLLDSDRAGAVLKSGHPVEYLKSEHLVKTDWLNGVSAWRLDACLSYNFDFLDARYSAFEDVIFSYKQRFRGNLVFDPRIVIDMQDSQLTDFSRGDVFQAASYWRLKFVLDNEEISKPFFLWSQVGRSFYFIWKGSRSPRAISKRINIACKVLLEIAFQIAIKKNANWSLRRHCTI